MRFRRQGPSLVVDAPAKLNLFLEVCGKRPDGYHELETLMVSIGLCDTLRFTPLPHPDIVLRNRFAHDQDSVGFPCGDSNLVVKAARLLAAATGCRTGAEIDLLKRIPSASGLGGGSSDAAATLVALNRLWRTGLDADQLDQLAAQLGSDLNFFMRSPRLAVCRGRGEIVEPRPLPRMLHFVVLRPAGGLSTADVFREWRSASAEVRQVEPLLTRMFGGATAARGGMFNALTAPAARLSSEIAAGLAMLEDCGGAQPLMTGSGSACFCLCDNASHARQIGRRVSQRMHARVWIVSTCV